MKSSRVTLATRASERVVRVHWVYRFDFSGSGCVERSIERVTRDAFKSAIKTRRDPARGRDGFESSRPLGRVEKSENCAGKFSSLETTKKKEKENRWVAVVFFQRDSNEFLASFETEGRQVVQRGDKFRRA